MIGAGVGGRAEKKALQVEKRARPAEKPYFLQVSIKIGLRSVDEFFGLAEDVRNIIEAKTGLRLVIAAESATRTEFLHVWTLPTADSLRDGMIKLAEEPKYSRLDALVEEEQQDFLTPIGFTPYKRPPGKGATYLEVSGHLATKNLAEFQAVYEVYPQLLAPLGLTFWGCFLNVSGRVNRVVSLWTLSSSNLDGMALRMIPGLDLLDGVSVDQWQATSYNP
jgi:hypothetical protein